MTEPASGERSRGRGRVRWRRDRAEASGRVIRILETESDRQAEAEGKREIGGEVRSRQLTVNAKITCEITV